MFNLTQQERQVILFLITIVVIGIGINFLAKRYSKSKVFYNIYQDIGKINLNTADKDLLMSVSGIGEKLAQRIIEYRDKEASFSQIEELKKIKGITDDRYDKIKDYLIAK